MGRIPLRFYIFGGLLLLLNTAGLLWIQHNRLQDPERAAELGRQARQVAEKHSWEHAVRTLLGSI